jgi:hypothetical protein
MRTPRWPFVVIFALVATALASLGWQRHSAADLRMEITRRRAAAEEQTRLLAENRRLIATQISVEELDALRAERTVISGLRVDLDSIRRRAETAMRPTASANGITSAAKPVESPLTQGAVPAGQWRNAGAATPDAAFETALWAAAGGDIEALAAMLALDAAARTKTDELLARLPAQLRNELGTPERLIALLTAKDVPLGSARITGTFPLPSETKLVTQLIDADGQEKSAMFSLQAEGGRWRLIVPTDVVEKYGAWLHAPPAAPALALPPIGTTP